MNMGSFQVGSYMAVVREEVIVHTNFTAYGEVTGVGFRAAVKRRADRLRLRGWVANTTVTERVIGYIEGPYFAVQEFKAWLALDGPIHASVHKVTFTDEEWTTQYEQEPGFNVVYYY